MDNNKKYWKGIEEKNNTTDFQENKAREFGDKDFNSDLIANKLEEKTIMPRRDFLKSLGLGLGAIALSSCEKAPVVKSIPYIIKPEEVTPGVANYYTSLSPEGYSLLVKTREGRPIKIEGNPKCVISNGATSAKAQASVYDLYDDTKLISPLLNNKQSTKNDIDIAIKQQLKQETKKIVLLSKTINSPSEKEAIKIFLKKYPNAEHIEYDPISYSAMIQANKTAFNCELIPEYKFQNAEVIVSVGANFLGTWLNPLEFVNQYFKNRNPEYLRENKNMSKHIQFETELSLTGSKADTRIPIKPSQHGLVLLGIFNSLCKLSGQPSYNVNLPNNLEKIINDTANQLFNNKGKALVVSGENNYHTQLLTNKINYLLESYNKTIFLNNPILRYNAKDADILNLIDRINNKEIGTLIFYQTNPYYSLPGFSKALDNVEFKISFSERKDETTKHCNIVAPTSHYLESWTDAQPKNNLFIIGQPTINPINEVYPMAEYLLSWSEFDYSGKYLDFIKSTWKNILGEISFNDKWINLLHAGFIIKDNNPIENKQISSNISIDSIKQSIIKQTNNDNSLEVLLYENNFMEDGRYSTNPFLQECPDPISKVTWDNYAAISSVYSTQLGLSQGDYIDINTSQGSITLPVLIQPGQANNTISIALGYGRNSGKKTFHVGENAYKLLSINDNNFSYHSIASINKLDSKPYVFAQTQTHQSLEGRDIIRETTLNDYNKDFFAGSYPNEDLSKLAQRDKDGNIVRDKVGNIVLLNLWEDKEKKGHHWGMVIDLNACSGCGSCVVSCNVENNVAVVGQEEVRRRREMHWIRIDRYYSDLPKNDDSYIANEDNIEVSHQPMMCQHCNHASCETVCPVLATMHSEEGLNQMVYNRCFGTRYCANNCAYKVRRFNWFNYANNQTFDYQQNSDKGKLMLNPDVVVRSRGVMEKCSMCVQRIQAAKLNAKMNNRKLEDGDIKMACQQSCPSNAIVFGDINDPNSRISKLIRNERRYSVLESTGVQPGIGYLTQIRNKNK